MAIDRSDELVLMDMNYYNEHGYPFQAWDKIRSEDPIHHIQLDDGQSYWAITRYDDITSICTQPEIFENAPKVTFGDYSSSRIPMLVGMDPPDHRKFRDLIASKFTPLAIQWVRPFAEENVNRMLDKVKQRNGEIIDVLTDIVAPVPTATVQRILGVSDEFAKKIEEWTTNVFGCFDPAVNGGMDPEEFVSKTIKEMAEACEALIAERQKTPGDDLVTALGSAQVDGRPLTTMEKLGFFFLLVTAGHETTQSGATTGLYTLLQHPDQLEKLRANPALMPTAVDEILRFTPPVIHFCRTPNRDVELGGKQIKKGETLVLFYPAANRDPAKFSDPHKFDIERKPNRHLAFGWGEHVCLGMHMGRMQISVILEQILKRTKSIEVVGRPVLFNHPAIGGVRNLFVKMEVE